jgi:hypothetical protein
MGFRGDIKSKMDETILRNNNQPNFNQVELFPFHFERTIMSTSTHLQSHKKPILVIGATGAQGQAVIDALLAPDAEGRSSLYTIHVFTRDPTTAFSQELAKRDGVEVVQGSFMDFDSVARALEGAYGAWVNTDGFTVGEAAEIVRTIH